MNHAADRRRPAWLAKADRLLGAVELTIAMVALVAILVFVFLQALQRYLPIEQFAWTGELARFCMMWLTFVLMGYLVTTRGHIALEVMDTIPSALWVRAVQTFALVVVAAVGVGLVLEAAALVSTQGIVRSPVLRLPMSWVYLPVLLGTATTAVRASVAALGVALHGPVVDPSHGAPAEEAHA